MEKNAIHPLNDLPGKPSCLMIIDTQFSLQKSHDDRLNKARVITKTEIKQKINVFRHSFITFVTEKNGSIPLQPLPRQKSRGTEIGLHGKMSCAYGNKFLESAWTLY